MTLTDAPLFVDPDPWAHSVAVEQFEPAEGPAGLPDDETSPVDPGAPFGRKPDGTPYKVPKEKRDAMTARLHAGLAEARARGGGPYSGGGRKGRQAAPRGRAGGTAPPRPAAAPKSAEYAGAAAGLLQIPAFALGALGRFIPVLAYDSAALSLHTPPIAEAIGEAALEDARLAAILERAAKVGPWGKIALAVLPLLAQIAVNHKALKPSPQLGTYEPEDLVKVLIGEQPDADDSA